MTTPHTISPIHSASSQVSKSSEKLLEKAFQLVTKKLPDNWDVQFHLALLYLRRSEPLKAEQSLQNALSLLTLATDQRSCPEPEKITQRKKPKEREADLYQETDPDQEPDLGQREKERERSLVEHHLCLVEELKHNFVLDDQTLLSIQKNYVNITQKEKNSSGIWNDVGGLYLRSGRFMGSQHIFETITPIFPDYLDALNNLALAYFFQDSLEEATNCFQTILRKEPFHIEALNNYSVLLISQHNFEGALKILERSISLERKQGYLWNNLGVTYNALSRFEDSLVAFRKAQTLCSELKTTCIYNEAISLLRQGRTQESYHAMKYLSSIDSSPHVTEALATLSVQIETDISKMYEQVLRLPSVSCQLLNNLANLLRQKEKMLEAQTLYERCLSKDPEFLLAYNNYALLKICQGTEHWNEALELLEAVLSKDPSFTCALSNKIKLLHLMHSSPQSSFQSSSQSSSQSSFQSSSQSSSQLSFNQTQPGSESVINELTLSTLNDDLFQEPNAVEHIQNDTSMSEFLNFESDSDSITLSTTSSPPPSSSSTISSDAAVSLNEQHQPQSSIFDALDESLFDLTSSTTPNLPD